MSYPQQSKCPLCGTIFLQTEALISTICTACNVKQWAWNQNNRFSNPRFPIKHNTKIKPMINLNVVNGHLVGFDSGWYIGRGGKGKKGSSLANPYHIGKDGSREQVIAKYRHWLWQKIQQKDSSILQELNLIRLLSIKENLNLVCFCKPKACHGDVIVKCVHWLHSQR